MSFTTFIAYPEDSMIHLNWNFSDISIVNSYIISYTSIGSTGQQSYSPIIMNRYQSNYLIYAVNDRTYTFTIIANTAKGMYSASIDATPPFAPTILTAKPEVCSVHLSWNNVLGVNSYNILYGTESSNLQLYESTDKLSFHIPLPPGTTYYFIIQFVVNNSFLYSNEVSCMSNNVSVTQNLIAIVTDTDTISLNWNIVPEADYYNLLYKVNDNTQLEIFASHVSPIYVVTGLNPNTTYYFIIETFINKNSIHSQPINITTECHSVGCYIADSKVFSESQWVPIQLLKKGDLIQTLNDGLVPIKFVGKRYFLNKLTEERTNNHLYKLSKGDIPNLFEDLIITGGHPLLIDETNLNEETEDKLMDMVDYGTPIVTEGKYRVFALIHPKAELWNEEGYHELYDIVLENNDSKKNYGIWVNGILTESMDEYYFLNHSGMTEVL
jgi:hypothetical protein